MTDVVEPVVPAADRGVTRIAERVVARLAVQAAREALRAEAGAPPVPHRRGGGPQATAVISRPPSGDGTGGLASIRVAVELGYPSDIGAQCRSVRRHIAERVRELAGMETSDVLVAVERLHSVHAGGDTASGRVR
ncbi:hypothetical protein [Streptomyces sp. NBC_01803]|uniref:hypothetical protein n=1 Tax=Streptomyces sp. NBC_01803 TaxID=2975946 RepID=UPI002DDC742D|nr:hypothetical protein [Streptomyces sp. NBC_01803]WSA46841.1 hypothetical protein OIE51_23240 [Streptomyces sp. NBC_01803]